MSELSFLGLALKAGKVELGEECAGMAARAGKAKVILTAADAGRTALVRARNAADAAKCPLAPLPFSKEELGAALGKGSVGVAAVTDIGFASAFIQKMAASDPSLTDIAAGLEQKNQRARERQKELRRHQQKLKKGKK